LRGKKGKGSWAIGRGLPKIPLLIDNTRQFQKFNEKLTTRKSNCSLIETQWTRQFVSLSFGIELRANKYQIEIEQTVGCSPFLHIPKCISRMFSLSLMCLFYGESISEEEKRN